MNGKRVINTLVSLGLSKTDARVYIHLAVKGPQESDKIAQVLKLQENKLRLTLEHLKNKGIVALKPQESHLFFALPFQQVLSLLMKAHLNETMEIEQTKEEILSKWQSMIDDSKS